MILKEYPPIIKNGKEVVAPGRTQQLVDDFVTQLNNRNIDAIVFHVNKDERIDPQERVYGASWSRSFTPDDLIQLNAMYLSNYNLTTRLAFLSQVQSLIYHGIMSDENGEEEIWQ